MINGMMLRRLGMSAEAAAPTISPAIIGPLRPRRSAMRPMREGRKELINAAGR